MNAICCPSCGTKIEIVPVALQAELPLGPIEVSSKRVNSSLERASTDGYPSTRVHGLLASCEVSTRSGNFNNLPEKPSSLKSSEQEDLFQQLRLVLREREISANGGLWRLRIRECNRAIRHAIEDWKLRTPDQQRAIKNRPAWLTDRYKRAHSEILKARNHLRTLEGGEKVG